MNLWNDILPSVLSAPGNRVLALPAQAGDGWLICQHVALRVVGEPWDATAPAPPAASATRAAAKLRELLARPREELRLGYLALDSDGQPLHRCYDLGYGGRVTIAPGYDRLLQLCDQVAASASLDPAYAPVLGLVQEEVVAVVWPVVP